MNFERKFINPILTIIKNNQDYLCKRENLPQLAKLGYIYNTLWYAGRVCWGNEGILKKRKGGYVCEDNPKYKIEMCEPNCQEHDDLIYDAWGMHITDEKRTINWPVFHKIVFETTEYSDFDVKMRKPNKTFDEWVEVLTDERFEYNSIYPNRVSVADHLLCVIGNGYGYKNGFIIKEASGADQDEDLYGFWENAEFLPKIKKRLKKLLYDPIVEQTLNSYSAYIVESRRKRKREDNHFEALKIALIFKGVITAEEAAVMDEETFEAIFDELVKNSFKVKIAEMDVKKQVRLYYPICEYSIITKIDENSHPSYIKAAIEICEQILENVDSYEKENRQQNIEFAKKMLPKFKQYESI